MQLHDPDPYAVLGVPRCANWRQIAQAYRRLAKRHHPDVDPHPAAADCMRRINAAWRTVSARRDRAQRDARMSAAAHATGRAAAGTAASWATWGPRPGGEETTTPRAPSPSYVRRPTRCRRTARSDARFVDTGMAALIAAGVMVLLLFAAAYAGSVSAPTPMT